MDIFEADDNSTPLTAEEKDGLKLKWITLRSELNEAEARNIAQAQIWLMSNLKAQSFIGEIQILWMFQKSAALTLQHYEKLMPEIIRLWWNLHKKNKTFIFEGSQIREFFPNAKAFDVI